MSPEAGDPARFSLRWFTPVAEVQLCGHATLASGAFVLQSLRPDLQSVVFDTRSGPLEVSRGSEGRFSVRLPCPKSPRAPWTPPQDLETVLRAPITDAFLGNKPVVVLEKAQHVRRLSSSEGAEAARHVKGAGGCDSMLLITAAGDPADRAAHFVHRFFYPAKGIEEDPVTGSAFTDLVPYWAEKLGLADGQVTGFQASARGGPVTCQLDETHVTLINVPAKVYMEGVLYLPAAGGT